MQTITTNIKLRSYQKDVMRGVLEHPRNSFHVVLKSRQIGISTLAELILLKMSIEKKGFSLYVTLSLKQARKAYKEVLELVKGTVCFAKSNDSYLEIAFKNGSVINFGSVEQEDSLRSFTVSNILVLDECAMIPDTFLQVILPTLDVFKAPCLMISTPRYRTGFFYEYYVDGLNHSGNKLIYSYDLNIPKYAADIEEIRSPEKVEFYRRHMPEDQFTREILGQFTDLGFGTFKHIDNCLWTPPEDVSKEKIHIGIDLATGSGGDETAITVFNGNKEMIDLYHFNDKDSLATIDFIAELTRKYHPYKVTVEKNSIGAVYYDLLKKRFAEEHFDTHLASFNTTNDSKNRMVDRLNVALQNGDVKLLKDEQLILQLSTFESKLTPTGKLTYAASLGNRDDIVMSLLIGFNSLYTGSYSYA